MKKLLISVWLCMVSGMLYAQQFNTLKGRVVNADGEPLSFASVQVADRGVTADARGFFELEIPAGTYQLIASSVGFKRIKRQIRIPFNGQLEILLKEDTQELDEVVVTATRTSRRIDNVPMPIQVIDGEQIEKIGSLRLDEALMEQTGLQLTSDHGTGIQMQGLNSEYIMFLIDSEPVIGRTAGTLELSRLAVDNIERIEIIKGPSSSLYGSEAMAGVVNIITKQPESGLDGSFRSRYRSFGTLDVSGTVGYAGEKLSTSLFVDRLSTEGFDLTPETLSMTAPPFQAYTFNPKISYRFTPNIKLSVNTRYYLEDQENMQNIAIDGNNFLIDDEGSRTDWNLMPILEMRFADKHNLQLRSYTTGYRTETRLSYQQDGSIYDENYFDQTFNRSEIQYDYYISDKHITTAGVGHTIERVDATRYDEVNRFRATYGFVQHQWLPADDFNVIVGGRYDTHSEYAARFSPKISAGYHVNSWLKVQASFGGGYKAPDFRQLLLNFTNPVAGYAVVGSSIAQEQVAEWQSEGRLERVFIDPAGLEQIQAETSLAYNAGGKVALGKLTGDFNFFRNEISNLIETAPIAQFSNGQNVFTYFNFDEVITQGAEFQANYSLLENLQFSIGYQYLDSRNVEDVKRLKAGEVFVRDAATNRTRAVTLSEYGGLINRSRHSGNAKVYYRLPDHDFDVSLRTIYRGRWGIGDANGNGIIDAESEYADGYVMLNLAVNKGLFGWLTIEAGANNLLDNTNMFEPSMPGRIWYGGISINLPNNK